eukprot:IDg4880t1
MASSTLEEVMVASDFVDTYVVPRSKEYTEYPGRPIRNADTSSRCLLAKRACTLYDFFSTDARETGSAEAAVETMRNSWRSSTASGLAGHIPYL